jgi:hypothetical protein
MLTENKCNGLLFSSFLSNNMSDPLHLIHRERWADVMRDLILATHCHSCGTSMNVSLIGYCGSHCSKRCWNRNEFELQEDFICPFGGCLICEGGTISLAHSSYHRDTLTGWPMRCERPCENIIIATRRPISIIHHDTE